MFLKSVWNEHFFNYSLFLPNLSGVNVSQSVKSLRLTVFFVGVEVAQKPRSGSDLDTIMAAIKHTEQCVLTKIDSPVMAAAAELHKKIYNLGSDLGNRNSECAKFTKVIEEVQRENATFATRIDEFEEEANGYANCIMAQEANLRNTLILNILSTQVTRLGDKTRRFRVQKVAR